MSKSFNENILKLPSSPSEVAHLWGSRCPKCGHVFFPQHVACVNCGSTEMEKVPLSKVGKIYSYTIVCHEAIKPEKWSGSFPYAFGFIDLPEGARVTTLFTDWEPDLLEIGRQAELTTRTAGSDSAGNDIIGYSFRPIK